MERVATILSTLAPYGSTISGVAILTEGWSEKILIEGKFALVEGAKYTVTNCSNGIIKQASGIITLKSTSKNGGGGKAILRTGDIGEGIVTGIIIETGVPATFNAQFQIVDSGQMSVFSK